jgi:hypothetical protein
MSLLQRALLVLAAGAVAYILERVWRTMRDPWQRDPDAPFGRFTPEQWLRYRARNRL